MMYAEKNMEGVSGTRPQQVLSKEDTKDHAASTSRQGADDNQGVDEVGREPAMLKVEHADESERGGGGGSGDNHDEEAYAKEDTMQEVEEVQRNLAVVMDEENIGKRSTRKRPVPSEAEETSKRPRQTTGSSCGQSTTISTTSNASTHTSLPKKKEPEAHTVVPISSSTNNPSSSVSYMLESGRVGPGGKVHPTQLRMTMSYHRPGEATVERMIRLQPGDDVMVFQDDDKPDDEEEANEADPMENQRKWPPARIQSFLEKNGGVYFNAQWYLSKEDIAQLPTSVPWKGPLTRLELLDSMHDNDIVLSNQTDENEIGAIFGLARVRFDDEDDESSAAAAAENNNQTYNCRYQLEVTSDEMHLMPYSDYSSLSVAADERSENAAAGEKNKGESDRAPSSSTTAVAEADKRTGQEEEHQFHREDGEGEDVSEELGDAENSVNAESARMVVAEGEGSVLRESIEIGPEHQAVVPPFEPDQPVPQSRNPKLVWKRGSFTDEQVAAFLNGVAQHHTAFLDRHRLSATAAYTPVLDAKKLERILQHRPERLTGSSLSTASMLAGERHRAALRKECDADAMLEILTECQGNVPEAIQEAAMQMDRITRGAWTLSERVRYNEGFRHHQGALRKIAKTLAPTKSMEDVVDYHFRCKIPDQFRQYQEKKREIAVRIVECMEEKRSFHAANNSQYHHSSSSATTSSHNAEAYSRRGGEDGRRSPGPVAPEQKQQPEAHWSELSVQEVATYTDARRRKARELMLDVKAQMGQETLAEVADLIRQLNQKYTVDIRKALLAALQGNVKLQERFGEFLPKSAYN